MDSTISEFCICFSPWNCIYCLILTPGTFSSYYLLFDTFSLLTAVGLYKSHLLVWWMFMVNYIFFLCVCVCVFLMELWTTTKLNLSDCFWPIQGIMKIDVQSVRLVAALKKIFLEFKLNSLIFLFLAGDLSKETSRQGLIFEVVGNSSIWYIFCPSCLI